jgi:hypothetical protein
VSIWYLVWPQSTNKKWDSVGFIVARLWDEKPEVCIRGGTKYVFLLQTVHNQLWGSPTLLFNDYRSSSLGKKRPRRETDHSPPYNVEIKNEWSYTSAPTWHRQWHFRYFFINWELFVVVDFKIIPCRICNEQVSSSGNGIELDSLDVHSDFRP